MSRRGSGATFAPDKIAKYSSTPTAPFICKECGVSFGNMNAMVMHHTRKHNPIAGRRQLKALRKAAKLATSASGKPTRKYHRKAIAPATAAPAISHKGTVQYCPCCGTNIRAVEMALSLTNTNGK